MTPRFEIGLHIVNPGRKSLEPEGIAYSVYLEDHKILTGASNDLPVIEPYSEKEITLYGVTNVMGGISLISDLMTRPRSEYQYKLEATLGLRGAGSGIRIVDEGRIDLDP